VPRDRAVVHIGCGEPPLLPPVNPFEIAKPSEAEAPPWQSNLTAVSLVGIERLNKSMRGSVKYQVGAFVGWASNA
jgi:hypothetical protein